MSIDEKQLKAFVEETAERLEVPGVAVGIFSAGEEHHAFHGVTSIENPLPVNEDTLFQFGSTGKTFTATAVLRLVDQGKVKLGEKVKTYVPELKLKDKDVEREVTVLHLLNHTAGWQGDMLDSTGDGDDAVAKYIELMANLEQVTPLGKTASYNNASLVLAGAVIAKVTGKTYEQAMKELIFEPLGLDHCFFFPNEIMTRRFAVGHNQKPDGTISTARPWALPRSGSAAGGISTNSADLIRWGRFHLGDGTAADGTRVLSEELLNSMKESTFDTKGSALGDAVGIAWFLRDVDGVRLVSHGGDTLGQHSAFVMCPEKDFVFSSLTNCGPNGNQFNEEVLRWALQSYIGVEDKDPEPIKLSDEELQPFLGNYETIAAFATMTAADGGLSLKVEMKPHILEQLSEAGEEPPTEYPPFPMGLLEGEGDRYIITDGPAKGMKGYFVRNADGEIEAVHVGGRLATRTDKTSADQ